MREGGDIANPSVDKNGEKWDLEARLANQALHPIRGPVLNGIRVGRFGNLEYFRRELLVPFEVRLCRERKSVLRIREHTNLPFIACLTPARFRRKTRPASGALLGWSGRKRRRHVQRLFRNAISAFRSSGDNANPNSCPL